MAKYHLTLVRWQWSKGQDSKSWWGWGDKRNIGHYWTECRLALCYKKQYGGPMRNKNRMALWPSNLFGFTPKGKWNLYVSEASELPDSLLTTTSLVFCVMVSDLTCCRAQYTLFKPLWHAYVRMFRQTWNYCKLLSTACSYFSHGPMMSFGDTQSFRRLKKDE